MGTIRDWGSGALEVVVQLAREWRDDRVGGLAAEIAFFGLLSLFPALLTVAAALGSLDALVGREVSADAEREIVEFLERVLTDEASGTITAVENLFRESSPGVLTVGLALALWSASRGFVAVVNALDVAYDLEERRPYVRLRAVALGLAFGSALTGSLMLAMLILGPLLGTGQEVADEIGLGSVFATLWDTVRWPLAVVVMVGWAATVLHVAPNHVTPWRWDLPGAVLAAASWGLISFGFGTYLSIAAGGNDVLGTLGGALIVLLWLYLLAVGLLLGGELNAILARRFEVPEHDAIRRPGTPAPAP